MNEGVMEIVPPGVFTTKAKVVPNGLVPLQSKAAVPDDPVATEAMFGVKVVQLLVVPDTAGIAGKVCVKRLVAA